MTGALDGVLVADFTQLFQGPLATQMLGDMGAEVIKIEPPKGDFFRSWSLGDRFPMGESLSFLAVNRNKRSIVLDLKSDVGLAAARRIVDRVDIVVENFRPGVMDRLGLGYNDLAASRPAIIYCASSGFGQDGPYRDFPGQDLLVQALGGTMFLNGRLDDPPTAIGYGIADAAAGLHIVVGVLAALRARQITGRGQRVDVNLLNSLMTMQIHEMSYLANTNDPPVRPVRNITAAYAGAPLGVYRTADGHLALAMMQIDTLGKVIGATTLDEFTTSNEFARRDEVHRLLEAVFVQRTTAAWLEVLRAADVWCAPVKRPEEALSDPQIVWNRQVLDVEHPVLGTIKTLGPPIMLHDTPCEVRRPPPTKGEHTSEVLAEFGCSSDEIAQILRSLPAPDTTAAGNSCSEVTNTEGVGEHAN